MIRTISAITICAAVLLCGCRTRQIDPRGPVPEPTIVKPELKKTEDAVRDTATKTRTVYETVERVVEKYPEDGLVKDLQKQAAAAKEQAEKTEATFQELKQKVEKAQEELILSTEKLKQWKKWYDAEYKKRVEAEASAKRKGKWLLGSGILNLVAIGAAFLLFKRPF